MFQALMAGGSNALVGGLFGGGGSDHGASGAYTNQYKEYQNLKSSFFKQPNYKLFGTKAYNLANMDWLNVGKTAASTAADQANQALLSTLAGRGGGNLASGLEMGSKARVGTQLQGLQAGQQLDLAAMGALNQLLQTKWAALTALFGKQAMVNAAQIGAGANMYGSDQSLTGQIIQSILGGTSSIASKGGA
jgi:hypothetical protein